MDGFNLYYRALKGTSYRWLNLEALFDLSLPNNKIEKIKYFTAPVLNSKINPGLASRQQFYLRALRTLPRVEIIFGHYHENAVKMPIETDFRAGRLVFVNVVRHEEKGSDVNLASHLLVDSAQHNYDVGVMVTNDSDLVGPLNMAKSAFNATVGLLSTIHDRAVDPKTSKPCYPNVSLTKAAVFNRRLRMQDIMKSQFPEHLTDAKGSFSRPIEWR